MGWGCYAITGSTAGGCQSIPGSENVKINVPTLKSPNVVGQIKAFDQCLFKAFYFFRFFIFLVTGFKR
jgi:hypothetical protein